MPSALDALAEAALLQSSGNNVESAEAGSLGSAFSARSRESTAKSMKPNAQEEASRLQPVGSELHRTRTDSSKGAIVPEARHGEQTDVDQAQQRVIETLYFMASNGSKKTTLENGNLASSVSVDNKIGLFPDGERLNVAEVKTESGAASKQVEQRDRDREQALRAANELGFRDHDGEITRCPCGSGTYQGFMLACESCGVWQHGKCMGIRRAVDAPEQYFCELCRPDLVRPQSIVHGDTTTKVSKKNRTNRGKRLATSSLNEADSKSTSNHSAVAAPIATSDIRGYEPNEAINGMQSHAHRSSDSTNISSMANSSANGSKQDTWPVAEPVNHDKQLANTETSSPRESGHDSPKRSRTTGSKGPTPAASPDTRSQADLNSPSPWSPQSPNAGLSREERKLQQIMQQFQRMEAEAERRRRREAEQHMHTSSSPSAGAASTDSNAAMTTATTAAKTSRPLSSPELATRSEPEPKRARGQARHIRNGPASGSGSDEITNSLEDAETTSSNRRDAPGQRSPSPTSRAVGNGVSKPSRRFGRAEGSSTNSNTALPGGAHERNPSSGDLPAKSRSFSGLSSAAEGGTNTASPVPLRIPLPPGLSASLLGNIYVTSAPAESADEVRSQSSSLNLVTAPRASPLASSNWLALHQHTSSPEGGGFLPDDTASDAPHSARFGKKVWLLHQHYQEQLAFLVDQPPGADHDTPAVESLPDHLERLRLRVQQVARFSPDSLGTSLPVKKKAVAAFRLTDPVTVSAPDSI
jgi:hypothetical protein